MKSVKETILRVREGGIFHKTTACKYVQLAQKEGLTLMGNEDAEYVLALLIKRTELEFLVCSKGTLFARSESDIGIGTSLYKQLTRKQVNPNKVIKIEQVNTGEVPFWEVAKEFAEATSPLFFNHPENITSNAIVSEQDLLDAYLSLRLFHLVVLEIDPIQEAKSAYAECIQGSSVPTKLYLDEFLVPSDSDVAKRLDLKVMRLFKATVAAYEDAGGTYEG